MDIVESTMKSRQEASEEEPLDLSLPREDCHSLMAAGCTAHNCMLNDIAIAHRRNICGTRLIETFPCINKAQPPDKKEVMSQHNCGQPNVPRHTARTSNPGNRSRVFRGQQAWLNNERSPLRQILKCLVCEESFDSLEQLTHHLAITRHHHGKADTTNSCCLKRQQHEWKRECGVKNVACQDGRWEAITLSVNNGQSRDYAVAPNDTFRRCALESLQEFVANSAPTTAATMVECQQRRERRRSSADLSTDSTRSGAVSSDSLSETAPSNRGSISGESSGHATLSDDYSGNGERFEKYRKLAAKLAMK